MAALRFRYATPAASHGVGGNLALTNNTDHSVEADHSHRFGLHAFTGSVFGQFTDRHAGREDPDPCSCSLPYAMLFDRPQNATDPAAA